MRRLKHSFFLTTATLMLAVWVGAPNGVRVLAQDPDFTNVNDILGGQRLMLPVEDLVVSAVARDPSELDNLVIQTNESFVGELFPYNIIREQPTTYVVAIGRMFNLPRDVIVTMTPGLVNVRDQDPSGFKTKGFGLPGLPQSITLADFTGDGFADMAISFGGEPGEPGSLQVVTATDINTLDAGLSPGPKLNDVHAAGAITAGDFNGDGQFEIAIAYPESDTGLVVEIYSVDPKSLSLTFGGSVRIGTSDRAVKINLAAGDYDGIRNQATGVFDDELVVGYKYGGTVRVRSLEVFADESKNPSAFRPVLKGDFLIGNGLQSFAGVKSGRLDWFGGKAQVVVAYNNDSTGIVSVLTVGDDLELVQASSGELPDNETGDEIVDLALGNFDQKLGPNSPPNLEIGIITTRSNVILCIIKVDPTDQFALNFFSQSVLDELPRLARSRPLTLVSGDTQGRSLLLGPPQIVRVNQHHQPDLILGAPPMHVDFITPAGASNPTVFNMSAVPDAFNSAYDTMDKTNDQSSRRSTTSFSYAFKESTEDSVTYGVPDIASVTATLKLSAQQTHDNTVSRTFNTYTGRAFNASTATGFGDQLRFMGRRFNVYVYPVIGHEVCPNGQTCPPAEKHPLQVMFSGPDRITRYNINASTVEWYQPFYEPGNVLSYPATADQLNTARKLTDPNFDLPQSALGNSTFFTDSSTQMVSIEWSEGGGKDISVGSSTTFSFDESVSVSGSGTLQDFGVGASGSASFSANQSKALNTLRTTTETVGASTGVMINKTGNFAAPGEYQYAVDAFIFGQPDPPGTFQTIQQMVDQQTAGPLEVGFTANPTDSGSGAWWLSSAPGSYGSAPDVALNHPVRWTFMQVGSQTPRPSNCILSSQDQMDCMTFNAPPDFGDQQTCPDLSCLWTSEFHWLRGLLITPADADGGPQLSKATAGDTLRLQTRVYNYSLAEMASGTEVHVRFYGQEWDQATNVPVGDSFLIEEVVEPPIPQFSKNDVNWIFAQTTFDTTNFADKYLIFWVVVWLERNGELVAELHDHGLTEVPGSLASIADVPIEMHSNNVGFLKSVFYVSPQQNTLEEAIAEDTLDAGLLIEGVTVLPEHVQVNERVEVTARLSTGAAPADGVVVTVYDGNPLGNGQAVDIERISHIRADDVYELRIPFRPRTCGMHELFVVAEGGTDPLVEGRASLAVPCEPLAVMNLKGKAKRVGSGRGNGRVKIKGKFTFGGMLDLRTARVTIQSLLNEAGMELVSGVEGMQLAPKRRARERKAVFETPKGEEPRLRLKLAVRGDMRLVARVRRAVIAAPVACGGVPMTTELALRLVVDDGQNEPVLIETVQPWKCKARRDGTVKKLRMQGVR